MRRDAPKCPRIAIRGVVGLMVLFVLIAAAAAGALEPPVISPYEARVTGDTVNTRSGPGDYWYVTGKLRRGDIVTVVGKQFDWDEIKPPAGQFSLILKADVNAQAVPGNGTVKGDKPAPVRAGPFGDKRLNRIQIYLRPGAAVTVLRDMTGAYYQIAPPPGATVYVLASLLGEKAAEPPTPPEAPPTPPATAGGGATSKPEITASTTIERPDTAVVASATTQPQPMTSAEIRARVLEDSRRIKAEFAKPLLTRDFAALLTRFQQLKAENQKAPARGVAEYADTLINYVQGQVRTQEAVRNWATTRPADVDQLIRDANRLPPPRPVDQFDGTGVLRRSDAMAGSASMPRLHKLEARDGQTVLCYLLPPSGADWSAMEGKPVRVIGRREFWAAVRIDLVRSAQVTPAGEPVATTYTPAPLPAGGTPGGLGTTQPVMTDEEMRIFLEKAGLFVGGAGTGPTTEPKDATSKPEERRGLDVLPLDGPPLPSDRPRLLPMPELRPVPPPASTTQGGG